MDQIATALLNLAAFVELSDDSVLDPDDAVKALEQLAVDLSGLDSTEIDSLRAARDSLLAGELSIAHRHFLTEFMGAAGIEPDD